MRIGYRQHGTNRIPASRSRSRCELSAVGIHPLSDTNQTVAATGIGQCGHGTNAVSGVLTVEIPAGTGAEVEITTLDAAELPSGLLTADAAMVGYELSPDGAKFSEA